MQAASWQAQERMQAEVERLTDERDSLARRLALAEDNVAAAAGADRAVEDQLEGLRRWVDWVVSEACKKMVGGGRVGVDGRHAVRQGEGHQWFDADWW